SSGAFEVVVVDVDRVGGEDVPAADRVLFVRKLALAAEQRGGRVLLLTAQAPRRVPWPVALRLELARTSGAIEVRVAKDPRGASACALGRPSPRRARARPTYASASFARTMPSARSRGSRRQRWRSARPPASMLPRASCGSTSPAARTCTATRGGSPRASRNG